MRRLCRLSIAAVLLLAPPSPAGAADLVQKPGTWAQDYTGRAADPALRFGQLPNGLRYAILHNAVPVGHMSLRLVIGSGSLAETRDEQGLAHFLEHMAFRGSTHVADGEMSRILARYGLSFGADLNATTSQLSTVFKFDFPRAADADVETGLSLFREIASELTIDPAAVNAERGVVLSEERLRDTAAFRQVQSLFDAWMPGQLASRRWPIGRVDVLRGATAEQLRGFYRREYRPDNAVLVAVGDFDPEVMRGAVETRFADWAATPAPPRPDLGTPAPRGPTAALFSEPTAPAAEIVASIRPFDDAAITDAIVARNLRRSFALQILDNRLTALTHRDDAPITAVRLFGGNVARSANVTEVTVDAPPERWQAALDAVLEAEQRLLRFGASQAELERVVTGRKAATAIAAGRAGIRPTPALADAVANDAINNAVTRSPAQNVAELDAVAASTDLAAIAAAARDLFSGSGPVAFVSTPAPPEGGVGTIRRVLDSAMAGSVTEQAERAEGGWPYVDFGPPGAVVDREVLTDLGPITLVRFANGATLTVKPMPTGGRVDVAVAFGQGRLGLPPALAHAFWLLGASDAFIGGGTGKLPIDDVRRAIEQHASPLRFMTDDRTFALAVQTAPAALDFALQLCTAFLTDPGFRPQAVERARRIASARLSSVEGSEDMVLARTEARALHGGDPRWSTIPTSADLAATEPGDLRALLGPELRAGPPHVVVVGDIGVEQAIASVARTLGALPPAPPREARPEAAVRFPPARDRLEVVHRGRADQASAVLAWPTLGFFADPAAARALDVAASIIGQRLVEGLRETDGATYSPNVRAVASESLPDFGFLAARVEVPPAKIALFRDRLDGILADLRRTPVTTDELQRAKQPMLQRRIRQMQEPGFWLNLLTAEPLTLPVRDMLRTRVSGLRAVTAEDVRDVAARFLAGPPFAIEVTAAKP